MIGTVILIVAGCGVVALFVWMKVRERRRDRVRER
jgi:hypothetical protein